MVAKRVGEENRAAVKQWLKTHLGGTQRECAKALGLSTMAVCRHVRAIRKEWAAEIES